MSRVCLFSLATLLACARAYEDKPAAPQALEPEVVASEGGKATLRCLFHGNPTPKITWRFRGHTIDSNADRYKLISDGALEINSLYRSDTGVYTCVADNDLGVATQEVHLVVNGFQTRNVTCRSREELEIVDASLCDDGLRPPTNQSCSPDPCLVQWVVGPWGECSQRCGSGGVKSREVTCQKIFANGIKSVVPDKECFDLLGPKPEVFQKCNEDAFSPTWFVGHWKPCNKLCDKGKQTRLVFCYQKKNGSFEELDDENCTEEKPEEEQPCMLRPCGAVDWVTSRWSECDSCTSKFRTRTVVCATKSWQVLNESFCSHFDRPADHKDCHKDMLPACGVKWYATEWSKCSVNCGDGVHTREVFCGMYYDGESGQGVEMVEDSKCANFTKYNDTKPCTVPKEECPSQWFAGPWSACSEGCGEGEQYRRVMCLQDDKEATDCEGTTVLESVQFCNTGPCHPDPVRMPARIDGDENTTVTGEQGSRLHVRCLAYGDPPPCVFWYRDDEEVLALHNDAEYEVTGNDLIFKNLSIDTLGPYTCRAYNGVGKAASWRLVVQAFELDGQFTENKFVVPRTKTEPPINTTTTTTIEVSSLLFTDPVRMPARIDGDENATVTGEQGSRLHVRCLAYGDPPPCVFWYRDDEEVMALHNDAEYEVTGNDLIFRSLSIDTLGPYTCRAYNRVGKAASWRLVVQAFELDGQFTENKFVVPKTKTQPPINTTTITTIEVSSLLFTDPVRMPARIDGDENATVTGEQGSRLHVRCLAYGDPPPCVFWYRDDEEVLALHNDAEYEVTGNDLIFKSLSIDTLGPYTCRAYNGVGKAASWRLVVQAFELDGQFTENKFVVPRTKTEPPINTTTTTTIEVSSLLFTETSTVGGVTETTEKTPESFETSEHSSTNEDTIDVISTTTQDPCSGSDVGCYADNENEASRPDGQGCPCNATEFRCCPDGVPPAIGREIEDGASPCSTSPYGCCQDDKTPAHGPDLEGCCLLQAFGCCPDNRKPAEGPHLEGCECQYALHGCCPDNVTVAQGADNQGCGCLYTRHGCCPDRHTTASGPNNEGCACNTYQFGCCADGVTIAKGPEQEGCHCRESKFGCCGDGKTHATGPDAAGCDCSSSRHGCCPDGRTEATGPFFLGCTDAPKNKQAACSMSTNSGPCFNFTLIWYYDLAYGGCSRFWYGGCDGNDNRFANKEECEDVCVHPSPKDVCKLPSVKGACDADYQRWHYNSTREQCMPFRYGGCLGNANNFDTQELCQKQCEPSSIADQCHLPIDQGSCTGNYSRWGFNSVAHRCEQFVWGGCEGNSNRFSTEAACQMRCAGTQTPQCTQPQDAGNCTNKEARWLFSQSENRCLPFYYSGCGGNDNQFRSRETCEQTCPSAYERNEVYDCDEYVANCSRLRCENGIKRARLPDGCEKCSCRQIEIDCESFKQQCNKLKCEYGIERVLGTDGCERCKCKEDPCERKSCEAGERCVVLSYVNGVDPVPKFTAECRIIVKPGACPMDETTPNEVECRRECTDDADCRGVGKCCRRGCNEICVVPVEQTSPHPLLTTTVAPNMPAAPQALPQLKPEVSASEGGTATLRCLFHGSPPPRITWRFGELTIDDNVGRYRLMSDGALEIVSLYRNDTGVYICVADNGLGVATQEVHLAVNEIIVPAKCTDNPFFAACELIVRIKFCRHIYYSKFCIKSCVEAGQLDPQEAECLADELLRVGPLPE